MLSRPTFDIQSRKLGFALSFAAFCAVLLVTQIFETRSPAFLQIMGSTVPEEGKQSTPSELRSPLLDVYSVTEDDRRELLGDDSTGVMEWKGIHVAVPQEDYSNLELRTLGRPLPFRIQNEIFVRQSASSGIEPVPVLGVTPLNEYTEVIAPTQDVPEWTIRGKEGSLELRVLITLAYTPTAPSEFLTRMLTGLLIFLIVTFLAYLLTNRFPETNSLATQENASLARPRWLGGGLFVVFFLLGYFPSGSALLLPDLDSSWQMALEFSTANQLRFGEEIIFTYGPLGFANVDAGLGLLPLAHLLLDLLFGLGVALSAVYLVTRFRGPLFWVTLLILIPILLHREQRLFLIIYGAIAAVILTSESRDNTRRLISIILIASGALALLSLIKLTYLVLAVFAVLMLSIVLLLRKQFISTLGLALSFPIFFVVLWIAAGQDAADILRFLSMTLPSVASYADMSLPTTWATVLWAAAGALVLVVIVLINFQKARWISYFALALFSAAAVYLNWRHAFLRVEFNHLEHLVLHMPLAGIFPLILHGTKSWRDYANLRNAFLILTLTILCQNIIPQHARIPRGGAFTRAELGLGEKPAFFHATLDRITTIATPPAPERASKFQKITADGMHFDLLSILNEPGTQYQPRPALQSYFALDKVLQQADLTSFLDPDSRPQLVRYAMSVIDGHWVMQEDARLLPTLFARTELVQWDPEKSAALFLTTHSGEIAPIEHELVATIPARFNDPVDLSPYNSTPILLQFHFNEKFLGKLGSALVKPPILQLQVTAMTGAEINFRFLPYAAENPFLANPILFNEEDLVAIYRKRPLHRSRQISSVTLKPRSVLIDLYEPDYTLNIYTLKDFTRFPDATTAESAPVHTEE